MYEELLWTVERRPLEDAGPAAWDMTACAMDCEEAEQHFRRHMMYIRGHEMRLVGPDGRVRLHYRDPACAATPRRRPAGVPLLCREADKFARDMA